jgi:hypothetical protein
MVRKLSGFEEDEQVQDRVKWSDFGITGIKLPSAATANVVLAEATAWPLI